MRKVLVLIFCLVTAASAYARPSEASRWTPDPNTIVKLESVVKIPDHPGSGPPPSIVDYARYYAGVTVNGQRMIRGELVIPWRPDNPRVGIHIGTEKDFPMIMDGGCGVVHLLCNVETSQIVSIWCNGVA